MKFLSGLTFFYQRKIEPGFKINKKSLVIDIGSGDKPFWRADVFLDKLSLGNVQRTSNTKTIHDIGLFVDSDVLHMPFKNEAFDFSFCSHLLEHVEDPAAVINEIVRISKSGYIEVPNGILETIQPFHSHLWFLFKNKKGLVFVRKTKKLHEILLENGNNYDYVLGKISEPFIRMYWKKTINYEVYDNKNDEKFESKTGSTTGSNPSSFNPYILFVKIIRKLFYEDKTAERLQDTFLKSKKN